MPQSVQNSIAGRGYSFSEDGFSCQDWPDLIRYESVTNVYLVPESGNFDIGFKNAKGKARKVSVHVGAPGQEQAVQAMLLQKVPGASASARPQTAWETSRGWITLGLGLAGLVVLIIVLNTVGRGTSVRVPIWLAPFIMLGSFLGVETLVIIAVAILVLFGVGALLSLRKRRTVWELNGRG